MWENPASFRNVASIRPGPEMPIYHVVGNANFYKQNSWVPQNLGTRGQEKHLFKEEKERPDFYSYEFLSKNLKQISLLGRPEADNRIGDLTNFEESCEAVSNTSL